MSKMRIIMLVIGLAVMIPMIVISLWGFTMPTIPDGTETQDEVALNGGQDLAQSMATDASNWQNEPAEIRDVFAADKFTNDRQVHITQIVDAADLLAPGEAAPDQAFLELYAAARAPARMIAFCAEIVETIGTKCDVVHTDAHQNRDGKIVLNGELSFVPSAALGDPAIVENGALASGTIALPYEGDLLPANDAEARTAAMIQAQSICDDLRTKFGNCVLTRVSFDIEELWITDLEVLPAGTNPQRLRISAAFNVYADPTEIDSSRLSKLLGEMADQRQL